MTIFKRDIRRLRDAIIDAAVYEPARVPEGLRGKRDLKVARVKQHLNILEEAAAPDELGREPRYVSTNPIDGSETYDLGNGRWVRFDRHEIETFGVDALLIHHGAKLPAGRVAVFQHGRQVGSVPSHFHPLNGRSLSPLYQIRGGDFRRDRKGWVASDTLCPGDLEAIEGFCWGRNG